MIARLIDWSAAAYLGGNFDEVKREHCRCGELTCIRGPAVGGAPRRDVIEQRVQRAQLLRRIFDHACVAHHDN